MLLILKFLINSIIVRGPPSTSRCQTIKVLSFIFGFSLCTWCNFLQRVTPKKYSIAIKSDTLKLERLRLYDYKRSSDRKWKDGWILEISLTKDKAAVTCCQASRHHSLNFSASFCIIREASDHKMELQNLIEAVWGRKLYSRQNK